MTSGAGSRHRALWLGAGEELRELGEHKAFLQRLGEITIPQIWSLAGHSRSELYLKSGVSFSLASVIKA